MKNGSVPHGLQNRIPILLEAIVDNWRYFYQSGRA